MSQQSSSASDPICPTYAAGTVALSSTGNASDILKDYYAQTTALTGSTVQSGNVNSYNYWNVGAYNNSWNNGCLTQSVTPTYSSGLLSFGNTGLQS